jgi:hypothetical protein
MAIAKAENKLAIVDFRKLDCPACDLLDENTFGNKSVIVMQDRYILLNPDNKSNCVKVLLNLAFFNIDSILHYA